MHTIITVKILKGPVLHYTLCTSVIVLVFTRVRCLLFSSCILAANKRLEKNFQHHKNGHQEITLMGNTDHESLQ